MEVNSSNSSETESGGGGVIAPPTSTPSGPTSSSMATATHQSPATATNAPTTGGQQQQQPGDVSVPSSVPTSTAAPKTSQMQIAAGGTNVSTAAGNRPVQMQQGLQQQQGQAPQQQQPGQAQPQPQQPQQQQGKDINTATVCRIGQETVQEIVGRIQEVFSYLKNLQPPVGNPNAGM